jgi:hypothetical protein
VTFLQPLLDFLHELPGSLKLAIALGLPVIAVTFFDARLRGMRRRGRAKDMRDMARLRDFAARVHSQDAHPQDAHSQDEHPQDAQDAPPQTASSQEP